ncbi:hypothetical protein HanXRQr2_Chr16g0768301 [Helianthus annuus]|uniref:Uncharacterized protein n=1 Tax=Helianthus annuus TaxID=4232 RepID=A0A9K3DVY5_HELAN|nr:hypothetical protein HanXRQr2_Chr16g0768301 [Helianthus annuus]
MIVASECPSCGLGRLQMIARKGFRLHLTFPTCGELTSIPLINRMLSV